MEKQAECDEQELRDTMIDVFLFTFGLAAGAFAHEAGHQVGAWIHGEELQWHGRRAICEAPCENIKTVALYGLGAQVLTSEILLLPQHRGSFTSGWLAWNVLQPISVLIRNELDHESTDLRHFGQSEARIVEGLVVAHAASVALRWVWKDKPEWVQVLWHRDAMAVTVVFKW